MRTNSVLSSLTAVLLGSGAMLISSANAADVSPVKPMEGSPVKAMEEAPAKAMEGYAVKAMEESRTVTMHLVNDKGEGAAIGTITFKDEKDGVNVAVHLEGLPPGARGFHLHENGSCMPAEKDGKMVPALAAGGHFDPAKTGMHLGPDKGGHAGDMPSLMVNEKGVAKESFVLHGVTVKAIEGRAVMVHAGGDNYSDQPMPLGGGGARIACGVIK